MTSAQPDDPRLTASAVGDREDPCQAVISDEWRFWIAENKLLEVGDERIVSELVRQGIEVDAAAREVRAAAQHPYFQAGEQVAQRLRKLESVLDVRRSLASLASDAETPERRATLSRTEFLESYYAPNRPVILTAIMEDWPALARWNPAYLKEACGDAIVEIVSGRDRDPRYEINSPAHKTNIRFGDYVDLVTGGGESNDYYLVANNGFFGRPEAQRLYADIRFFPEFLDPANGSGRVFFWFGPAGTVTPLHHDVMNVLLAQVYGRKQITLISPDQTPWVYNEVGVYSEVDCDNPDHRRHPLFSRVRPMRFVLQPGESLFLPVGWWHHVKALDVSMTVTFTNFIHPNDFEWSQPHLHR
ncbi:MAG TPA: cupin-like domain-containing protein [Thermoanaerobaculia bacterium]|nr:cupin-like domain-containing protein [Thermoanaerobaculia bacterium]